MKMQCATKLFIGSSLTDAITAITNASALNAHDATKMNPKIVDYHSGSSDINQSIDAKLTVKINSTMPGPLSRLIFLVNLRSAVRS